MKAMNENESHEWMKAMNEWKPWMNECHEWMNAINEWKPWMNDYICSREDFHHIMTRLPVPVSEQVRQTNKLQAKMYCMLTKCSNIIRILWMCLFKN